MLKVFLSTLCSESTEESRSFHWFGKSETTIYPLSFLFLLRCQYHASDWAGVYGFLNMTSYLVYFIANLEPNIGESTDQLIKRCWSC